MNEEKAKDEMKEKVDKVAKNVKSMHDNTLESRIDDIQTDPEFEFRERRLQKKLQNSNKDQGL